MENANENPARDPAEANASPDQAERPEGSVATEAEEALDLEAVAEPSLEDQLEKAKTEAAENYNNYLRAVADLDTYRRRVAREKDELRQYAISGVLEDFLPVYDNLALGLASAEQSSDPKVLVQGIQMVLAQFKSLLGDNGVAEINPPKGGEFDPNTQEAFQTLPSDEVEEGKVLSVMRKGFTLKGRLVRAASVVVSGGPAKSE